MWIGRHVFEKSFSTTEQGRESIVAAAIRKDLKVDKDNISANGARGAIIYMQPFANPFSIFGGRWFADSSSSIAPTINS